MSETAVQLMMTRSAGETDSREWVLIIEKAAAGDVSAFEQVMLRTERSVLLMARRLLGNPADAEEAAQEVFIRVFKYLHRFDRSKPFEPWLYRLTVNVCNDIASRRARPGVEVRVEDHEPIASGFTPHETFSADERRLLVQSAVESLPHKQRAAVVLRDLQGLSTAEVAHALDVSEATVRSHLSSARLRLKRFIEKRLRRKS
jgi:RNA polymerase sigma-70 factor (ECF subfamily)